MPLIRFSQFITLNNNSKCHILSHNSRRLDPSDIRAICDLLRGHGDKDILNLLNRIFVCLTIDSITIIEAPAHNTAIPSGCPIVLTYKLATDSTMAQEPPLTVRFEFSAGLCVTRKRNDYEFEILAIRRNEGDFFELPKGHVERGECLHDAACREFREETGLLNCVYCVEEDPILSEIYTVAGSDGCPLEKTVHYFRALLQDGLCPHSYNQYYYDKQVRHRDIAVTSEINSDLLCESCSKIRDEANVNSLKLNSTTANEPTTRLKFHQDEKICGCGSHKPYNDHYVPSMAGCLTCGGYPKAYFGNREAATRGMKWFTYEELIKTDIKWKSDTVLQAAVIAVTAASQYEKN